jgi:hypothetical protein
VGWVTAHCKNCKLNRAVSVRAPLQPIIVNSVFERVQIDLIDFRHEPSLVMRLVVVVVMMMIKSK